MRFIFTLFLFVTFNSLFAQSKIEYIEQQLVNVETELQQIDKTWKLDNIQKQQMIKIFDDKFRQVDVLLNSGKDKLSISQGLDSIEKEFRPKVEALLTLEQRISLKKQI